MSKSKNFGTDPLGQLLRQQAIPAAIGIFILAVYNIADTIFVGRWVGTEGISALTVVGPILLVMATMGMAIGIGGSSVISRALGEQNPEKAYLTFGNQVIMTVFIGLLMMVSGYVFADEVLWLFGAREESVIEPAKIYYNITLFSVPFFAWSLMANNVIRAIGYPKVAMRLFMVPAAGNMILDPLLMLGFDMGMAGAAWATAISFVAGALYSIYFFLSKESDLKIGRKYLQLDRQITKEILSLGSVTMARQATISVFSIVLNNALVVYGGIFGLAIWGIIQRMMMFLNFPVLGITQGFVPIVGFNYGARLFDRVKELIKISFRSASLIALGLFTLIMIFTPQIVNIFSSDEELIRRTVPALRKAFLATPLLAFSLLSSAYFQAVGKALPALLLTLTKQGFFLIPLLLLLPRFFGLDGIWYAFPIADVGAAAICYWYLKRNIKVDLAQAK